MLLTASAITAHGASIHGPARWDKPALTVHVGDQDAWAGTDVAAAIDQWAAAFPMTLVDQADADVVLTTGPARTGDVGATARTATEGSTITGCRVDLPAKHAGKDMTDVLTHELGHCLGLGHLVDGPAVMYWTELSDNLSPTVTKVDVAAVRALYR
ncbi:matrixin family metalloprotease [Oryzobacter sp. R7]|uniref:matrixin family metalloprotease n=1 Tax=Oryzobacter faecalis TaxID=3388656 RepID=UPI00398CBBFC